MVRISETSATTQCHHRETQSTSVITKNIIY